MSKLTLQRILMLWATILGAIAADSVAGEQVFIWVAISTMLSGICLITTFIDD